MERPTRGFTAPSGTPIKPSLEQQWALNRPHNSSFGYGDRSVVLTAMGRAFRREITACLISSSPVPLNLNLHGEGIKLREPKFCDSVTHIVATTTP